MVNRFITFGSIGSAESRKGHPQLIGCGIFSLRFEGLFHPGEYRLSNQPSSATVTSTLGATGTTQQRHTIMNNKLNPRVRTHDRSPCERTEAADVVASTSRQVRPALASATLQRRSSLDDRFATFVEGRMDGTYPKELSNDLVLKCLSCWFRRCGKGRRYAESLVGPDSGVFPPVIAKCPGNKSTTASTANKPSNTSGKAQFIRPAIGEVFSGSCIGRVSISQINSIAT